VKGITDPVATVVVSTAFYLHFVSYALTLTALRAVGLHWWRLSSRVLSCVGSSVLLLSASSIGSIVGDVACSISTSVGWR
jgi:hypothetical protein